MAALLGAARGALTALTGISIYKRVLNVGGDKPFEADTDPTKLVTELRMRILSMHGDFMDEGGRGVKYEELARSTQFQEYLVVAQRLKWVDLTLLGEEERRAVFINIYNSLMIHGLAVGPIPSTILQRLDFYASRAYNIGGHILSLDDIEHGVLRGNRPSPSAARHFSYHFRSNDPRLSLTVPLDPRVHFTLNCGAKGCPAIRYYDAAKGLDAQLDRAAKAFCSAVEVDVSHRVVRLSMILHWYMKDFGDSQVEMIRHIQRWFPQEQGIEVKKMLEDDQKGSPVRAEFVPYDWDLNSL